MEKFLQEILGTIEVSKYLAWFLLAFLGAFTRMLILAKQSYKKSNDTPYQFSYKFMFRDNTTNLFIGFFITYFFLRFSFEFLNFEPTAFFALGLGLSSDYLADKIVKFTLKARK